MTHNEEHLIYYFPPFSVFLFVFGKVFLMVIGPILWVFFFFLVLLTFRSIVDKRKMVVENVLFVYSRGGYWYL